MQLYRIDVKKLIKACIIKREPLIKIDDHLEIRWSSDFRTSYIYIDDVKVYYASYYHDCYGKQLYLYSYLYRIPKQIVKKINNWSRFIVKQKEQNEKEMQQKIQQHINSLYED